MFQNIELFFPRFDQNRAFRTELAGVAVQALATLTKFVRAFPQFLRINAGIVPRLGHDRYLQNHRLLAYFLYFEKIE
jgi:hypothetical protein